MAGFVCGGGKTLIMEETMLKGLLRNINFSRDTLAEVQKLGIENFSAFVRKAVEDKIRDMKLNSLVEHYQNDMDEFDNKE